MLASNTDLIAHRMRHSHSIVCLGFKMYSNAACVCLLGCFACFPMSFAANLDDTVAELRKCFPMAAANHWSRTRLGWTLLKSHFEKGPHGIKKYR